jgi:hypothetical protein
VGAATASRSGRVAAGAIALVLGALVLGVAILAALLGQKGCQASGPGPPPSQKAKRDIPADFLAIYQRAGARYGIPWEILAGIGKEECDHGRFHDASCTPQPGQAGPGAANFAGAAGPMQIGIGGAAGCAFCSVRVDANGDGSAGTHDPDDAVAMAARLLLEQKGAPKNHPIEDYRSAVRAYNGSGPAADAYASRVLADAHAYASGNFATTSASGGCSASAQAGSGVPGKVVIAPGANRAGAPLQPITLDYVAAMAGLYGKRIVISTGTNHDQLTVDGNVSDHWDGHAADLGMALNGGTDGGPVGDALMSACLQVAGEPAQRAASDARRGGLYTLHRGRLRIQCIWKTFAGGDHYTHVHVGVRRE